MKKGGLKIALEGIDGVGKTTQARMLQRSLEKTGKAVTVWGSQNDYEGEGVDEDISKILKTNKQYFRLSPFSQILLQAARSSIIHKEKILPRILDGQVVISDRDIETVIAYSLPSLKTSHPHLSIDYLVDWIYEVNKPICYLPDISIILMSDLDAALTRAVRDDGSGELENFTNEQKQYFSDVQNYYSLLSEKFPERIKVIDVTEKGIDDVHTRIVNVINRHEQS